MFSFVIAFLKALFIIVLAFMFRLLFLRCLDLFKYRGYRFLSVVLLVFGIFVYLCSIGGILYV